MQDSVIVLFVNAQIVVRLDGRLMLVSLVPKNAYSSISFSWESFVNVMLFRLVLWNAFFAIFRTVFGTETDCRFLIQIVFGACGAA